MSKLLMLATVDMRQAATAARMLKGLRAEVVPGEAIALDHSSLMGVLETGLVVAYMRPYSWSKSRDFDPMTIEFVPAKWRPLHERLKGLRDQVYAHIDDHPNRDAGVSIGTSSGGGGFSLNVHTVGLSPEDLDEIIELCDEQAMKFEATVAGRVLLGYERLAQAPGAASDSRVET